MPSPIDINTNKVLINKNASAPEHILLSPQAFDYHYTLSIKSSSSTSNSNSSMGVTPDKNLHVIAQLKWCPHLQIIFLY